MTDRLFTEEEHTSKYRLHRPNYPQKLYDHILDYYFDGKPSQEKIPLALDVACGSGQATVDLSKLCQRVIGIDTSANQIANAIPKDNVEYRCEKAEDLSFLEENSVDLVTVATALHWLDIEQFVEQVQRILKPNTGVFAVWTYALFTLDNPRADAIYHELDQIQLFPYSDTKRWLGYDYYKSLLPLLPYALTRQEYIIEQTNLVTIKHFLGMVESSSASQTYRQQNGEKAYKEMITSFGDKLVQCYTTSKSTNDTKEPPNYDTITMKLSCPQSSIFDEKRSQLID